MNKKSICVAIASLLCLGGITACSEIEAKENGKKKKITIQQIMLS